MNAEEMLLEIRRLDQLINTKLVERTRLRSLAVDISPKPMNGMPFDNTNKVSRTVEANVIKIVMLSQEIDELIDQYIDRKREILGLLEKLPAREYAVLHRFYILSMTIEHIADELDCSTVQVWRIKKKGLENFQNVIDCNAEM